MPNTKQDMMSGLGERKGSYFLENGTTYALYTNDNGLTDSYQAHGRKIVHGRNGFHNIIYGQHENLNTNFAIVLGTNEGKEVTYTVSSNGTPTFAVECPRKEVLLHIYFDMQPLDMARAVF
jgi:hypothetical protein